MRILITVAALDDGWGFLDFDGTSAKPALVTAEQQLFAGVNRDAARPRGCRV